MKVLLISIFLLLGFAQASEKVLTVEDHKVLCKLYIKQANKVTKNDIWLPHYKARIKVHCGKVMAKQ